MNARPQHNARPRRGFGALVAALKSALQWRLILLWLLATLVPTLLAAIPLFASLQSQFGRSLHAAAIASGHRVELLLQGLDKVSDSMPAIGMGVLGAAVMVLLLSPWLTGMVVASLRAGRRLGFGELVHGGIAEYWRMLRMLLWSIIPLGIALAIGGAAMNAAGKATEAAVLSSEVESASRIALMVAALLFVLVHASVEAGRGWLGADAGLRSVIKAWWRGLKLLLRRPLATLGVYLGSCIVGIGLALVFAYLRLQADGVGTGAMMLSFLLAQAMVAALAWGRIIRLYGLSDLAADTMARPSRQPQTSDNSAAASTPSPA